MDSLFAQAITAWQTFYFTLATVAATLMGLVFVAVSLHLREFTDKARPELQTLAYKTFTSFVNLLLYALFFLVPHATPLLLALTVGATALIALGTLGRRTPAFGRQVLQTWGRHFFFWRFLVPGTCHVLVAAVALTLYWGATTYLFGMVAALLVLLIVTARNAWDLLVQVGQEARTHPSRDEDDPQLRRLEQQLRDVTRRQRQITRQQEEAGRDLFPPGPRRRG